MEAVRQRLKVINFFLFFTGFSSNLLLKTNDFCQLDESCQNRNNSWGKSSKELFKGDKLENSELLGCCRLKSYFLYKDLIDLIEILFSLLRSNYQKFPFLLPIRRKLLIEEVTSIELH